MRPMFTDRPLRRFHQRSARAARRGAIALGLGLCGCQSELLTLGEKPLPSYHFGPPRLVAELASSETTENPTLTGDLLEIYFSSSRDGNDSDIWFAQRTSAFAPFDPPRRVRALDSPRQEWSSAVATDGLTLWFGSDRRFGSGLDIWVTTRSGRSVDWNEPEILPVLNSPANDVARPPGMRGLVMPLGSERGSPSVYRSYFATRASITSAFDAPQPIPELIFPDATTMDVFLTDDGLTIFYASSTAGGPADFFTARRRSTSDPFSSMEPVLDLNTTASERDPWLSPDGTVFFFASDRSGTMNIYTADVILK